MRRVSWKSLVLEVGVTALIVGALWIYTENHSSYFLPTFGQVWRRFHEVFLFDRIVSDVLPSLRRLALGYTLAVASGVIFGVALGMSPILRLLTYPVMAFLRSIPPVALIPPAIITLGIDDAMKVFVIAFVCLWPVLLNTAEGIAELDKTIVDTARAYGLSFGERLFSVVIPAVGPRIFVGMRNSLSFALLLLVASEFLAGTNGIGFFISQAQVTYRVADMWAGIVMLSLIGYSLSALFNAIERRVIGWSLPNARPHE